MLPKITRLAAIAVVALGFMLGAVSHSSADSRFPGFVCGTAHWESAGYPKDILDLHSQTDIGHGYASVYYWITRQANGSTTIHNSYNCLASY